MISEARTSDELVAPAWQLVQDALLTASSERRLITHWFLTPTDASVHTDEHWDDNARAAKFLRIVVPTLADQLKASMLAVAIPWDVTDEHATLTLVTLVVGEPAAVDARDLTRTALVDAAPYWRLSPDGALPPAELSAIAGGLKV